MVIEEQDNRQSILVTELEEHIVGTVVIAPHRAGEYILLSRKDYNELQKRISELVEQVNGLSRSMYKVCRETETPIFFQYRTPIG